MSRLECTRMGPVVVVVIIRVGYTDSRRNAAGAAIDPADCVIINSYLNLYFRPRARHRVFSNGEIVSKF